MTASTSSNPVTPSSAPPASALGRLALLARDVKISHTVFAMPFALLATFLAAAHGSATVAPALPSTATLTLIVVCMVLARTMAMAVNRWADRKLDALNPRTAGRAVPSGRLSPTYMLGVAIACAGGFIAATIGFWLLDENLWPLLLSPLVLAWLAGYSFAKRFTWLCHLHLGSALAMSPVAAVIAVQPALLSSAEPYLLAGMVMCWVAGFDIIYALQDVESDRQTGVYSLPAKLGANASLWIARALHACSLAALFMLTETSPMLAAGFTFGAVIVALLLITEHALVWGSKTNHIHMAFFTLNGLISLLLGGLGVADVVMAL